MEFVDKERRKVAELRKLETEIQKAWDEAKAFESNNDLLNPDKYVTTFPFPYMNGRLHLGHTFSISKCEFTVGYQRLRGKNCLFPFAFHCTGMPIKACADKLAREIQEFGYPPNFPADDRTPTEENPATQTADDMIKDKGKSKKSKAVAKAGGAKYQWQIMKSLGLSDEEVKPFADSSHWLAYFPPKCIYDVKRMGARVDWRRAFVTTDVNPYFDAFVQWQFRKLKEAKLIAFGKRYTIFSPKDGQPCMDHDRSSGEGVGPQEYTLMKLKIKEPTAKLAEALGKEKRPVFMVAATLRPETMYGQTNCFVHPDITYSAFYVGPNEEEIFIATTRAARNMAYQQMTVEDGKIHYVPGLEKIKGIDLIGCGIEAPLSHYDIVFALPMLSVKDDKGTGIVTSVPSDSPDDYTALTDLKKKEAFRQKYNVADHMVLPYDPVSTLEIPEYGNLAAVAVCEKLKITSQNDRVKLEEAKKEVYLKGFYDGVMLVGAYKSKKIADVKKHIQAELFEQGAACKYVEPEKKIISRSGDECVVALCDQWYLNYGDPAWKADAKKCVEKMNTFSNDTKKGLEYTIEWLHEYACSRSYGLGTKLPWDQQYLIESLSDSTIYNAYYTVAHLLQADLYGQKTGSLGIKPEQLTDAVWDYVFLQVAYDSKTMPVKEKKLSQMRQEFKYWYPVNMRSSGKDLIQNHLSYYVFAHVAIWKDFPEFWPIGIRANGHLLLNNEKMSKNTGNFMTLHDAIDRFSADGMRLSLADAGDGLEDANFVVDMADAGLLRLYNFLEWVKEVMQLIAKGELRPRDSSVETFADRAFANEMNRLIDATAEHYERVLLKEALKTGFFEYQLSRDNYKQLCGGSDTQMRADLALRFIETQALILSPICPHIAERIWQLLGKDSLIVHARWPETTAVDEILSQQSEFLHRAIHEFRLRRENRLKAKKPAKGAVAPKPQAAANAVLEAIVYVATKQPQWKLDILNIIKKLYEENGEKFPANKEIAPHVSAFGKDAMPFVQMIREKADRDGHFSFREGSDFDQTGVLESVQDYLTTTLQLSKLTIVDTTDASTPVEIAKTCSPGAPVIMYTVVDAEAGDK